MMRNLRFRSILAVLVRAGSMVCLALLSLPFAVAQKHTGSAGEARQVYYVSSIGSDHNPGTINRPFATIQRAVDLAMPGTTIYVRTGVYRQPFSVSVSGSANGGYITIRNYPHEHPVLDGANISAPDGGMITVDNQSYVKIEGFEIRDNYIHDMGTRATPGDAFGIAVYGYSPSAVNNLNHIVITGNTLTRLTLGSSESLTLNGNVSDFVVADNVVHDNNNIGIDAIGWEGTSSGNLDSARDGVIEGNTVYNITSLHNPSYGDQMGADGIYVDGGQDVIIERNVVHNNDIGIELASEHHGKPTQDVIARNNLIYFNNMVGVTMGGYDAHRGYTLYCEVLNNTLFENDTYKTGTGEIHFGYDTRNNLVENNIVYAGAGDTLITNEYTQNRGNIIDHNLYYAKDGADSTTWQWKNVTYNSFSAYRAATGLDSHSFFADPLFSSIAKPDLHLRKGSPAAFHGVVMADAGKLDIDNLPRVAHGQTSMGASNTPRS